MEPSLCGSGTRISLTLSVKWRRGVRVQCSSSVAAHTHFRKLRSIRFFRPKVEEAQSTPRCSSELNAGTPPTSPIEPMRKGAPISPSTAPDEVVFPVPVAWRAVHGALFRNEVLSLAHTLWTSGIRYLGNITRSNDRQSRESIGGSVNLAHTCVLHTYRKSRIASHGVPSPLVCRLARGGLPDLFRDPEAAPVRHAILVGLAKCQRDH